MRYLVALVYDKILGAMNEKYFKAFRAHVLSEAKEGKALEIGAGTGMSLGAWNGSFERLVLQEPSKPMREQLKKKVARGDARGAGVTPEIVDGEIGGEGSLPFEDNAFDTVLVSLVFCGIDKQREACKEIRRVLKDGGRFCFVEHVRRERGFARFVTALFNWLWLLFWCCSATRDTHKVFDSMFEEVNYKKIDVPWYEVFLPISVIYGTAIIRKKT